MKRSVEMFYDDRHDRWMVYLNNRPYGLHCGEYFELVIGANKFPCRLELGSHWFVMMQDVRLNLRTRETYKVII